MKKYLEILKSFHQLFTLKERLSAMFGGLLFSFLIFMPLIILLAEVMVVYIYMIYTLTVLAIFIGLAFSAVASHLEKKALFLKKPELVNDSTVKSLLFIHQIVINSIIVIIGLCFLLWWIPILMV
ncbi:MAG: hypothetical protein KKE16_04945 [Firmicutes bacterium]|nr:hypothetical protein [Bacillota bacterium]